MRIRWNRVAAILLLVLLIVIGLSFGTWIVPFVGSVVLVFDGHSTPDEHLKGMMAFGLLAILLLAVLRLLLGSPGDRS